MNIVKSIETLTLKTLSLRPRHLTTTRRKLRLRYSIPMCVIIAVCGISATNQFLLHSSAQAGIVSTTFTVAKSNSSEPDISEVAYLHQVPQRPENIIISDKPATRLQKNETTYISRSGKELEPNKEDLNQPSEITLASFYKSPNYKAPETEDIGPSTIKIKDGQTVTGRLQEIGVSSQEAYSVVKALGEHYDPRRIRSGQAFELEYSNDLDEEGEPLKSISKMVMPVSPAKQIVVYKDDDIFKSKEVKKEVKTQTTAGRASVKYSLYGSAAKANIPDEVIANMIKIFSWNVDFQRDIRSGDEIEILYETKMTDDGTPIGYGDILYARLVTGGRDLSLYRHELQNGTVDYFDSEGHSIKRTLMKTPIDGARMSSGFGMRHHPVLGYNKMHKGIDFAAPRGTPIYAAGDGIIEKAGRNGSYGNYVRIRHNSKLKTAYAHMNNIQKGIRSGSRVKQGQIIGYVGTTGRSTGPHLHYEVMINGAQANPRGVNVPTGETLTGQELKRFKANKVGFDQKFANLVDGEKYAALKTPEEKDTKIYNN